MGRILSHLDKEKTWKVLKNNKNVIKLYYFVYDKPCAILNFVSFWWININTVVLLRLILVRNLGAGGEVSEMSVTHLRMIKIIFFLKCFLFKICLFTLCEHQEGNKLTWLALLLQENRGVMWFANTNGSAINNKDRHRKMICWYWNCWEYVYRGL